MSNVKIEGNASGTGTFTIAAPNSNTDRVLTLPDEAGTVLTSASDIASQSLSTAPLVIAGLSANQTNFTNAASTKIVFNSETIDSEGWFDTSNGRFTPQVAGYYKANVVLNHGSNSATRSILYAYKNGSLDGTIWDWSFGAAPGNNITLPGSRIIYLNGSTDYCEFYHYQASGTTSSVNANHTQLSIKLVRAG